MSGLQRNPEIVVFAGPNGSGKSTFTNLLKPAMDYINADEIKKKGYFIRCFYILTAVPMINVFRFRARVKTGGHDVPENKIICRYDKALALVHEVVSVCDICHIYDNSEDRPYRIYKKRKECSYFDVCEDWTKEDIFSLTLDKNAEEQNLNMDRNN